MDRSDPSERQCTAKSTRTGKRCGRRAIRGGFVCATHGGSAPQVKRKALERLEDLIDPKRLLREAAKLAYSDVREVFDEDGNLKPPAEWPDAFAAAVSSVEVVSERTQKDGTSVTVETTKKLRLWDKPANIQLLFRHLGLLKDRLEISGDAELLAKLAAGRAYAAKQGS